MTISLGQSQNMISNSYFTSGTGWAINGGGAITGGEARWLSTAAGGNTYDNELKWTGLSLTNAATYTVTFRARAASNRIMSVNLQNTGIWSDQFRNNSVALTTTMTIYSYTFNATSTNSNVQLNFHVAGAGSTAAVYIDDVTLVAGTTTQCTNFIQDADETGVDCGGSTCGVCLITPTFNPFTVGPKLVGDAPFTVSATSDSPGAITYTSSNTGVATVSGNTITVVSAGTTTITANQAASGGYYAGSTSATLTVSFSPPATAAPTQPARNAWDVVSLYSGSYTPTAGATWQHGVDVNIASSGNNARFFNGFTLARLAFGTVNLTTAGMTHLHLSVYTHNQNQLWFELQGNRRVESSIALNGWVEFNIPLTAFTGLNLATINFFDLNNPTGAGLPAKVVYMDDVYFYRAATSPAPTFGAFTVPAKLVGDAPFNLTAPTSNSAGAITYTSSNTAVATVSGNTVTVVGIGSTTITANQAADAPYAAGSTTATLNVTAPAPTIAAPIPPARNAWDVVSVYSGSYTPVAGTRNYNPNWGGTSGNANFAQPSPAGDGNQVLKYVGVGYQGIDIGSTINLTTAGMTTLHVDIWTTNQPSTDFRIIDGADRSKVLATAGGVWNSFDIPLTDFVGLNKTNVYQFKIQPNPFTGTGEWYIDNIYFYRAATLLPPTLGALTVPAKFTNSAPFTLTAPTSNSPGAFSYTSSNTAVATVNASTGTVTIVGAGTTIITATQAESGTFGSASATANLVVTFPIPTVAAPTPTVPAINVISIFSNAYTDQAGTNFNPNWGQQGSVADVTIAGNATKRYSSLNYQGTQFTTINAVTSNLQSIHFDFLSPNTNLLKVSLISNTGGGEKAVLIPVTPLNSWKSVDILLSQFSSQGLNLTGLFQIKIENYNNGGANNGTLWVSGGELYIDNIYFSDVVTNVAPIISGFTIPIKLVGDAPFNLTAPTSNSAGAFTYTSSNTAVATVSGNTVTVIGAGTSVITATQAANGSYTSGSITTNLVVSGGPTVVAPAPTKLTRQVSSVFSNPYPNTCSTTYDNYGGPAVATVTPVRNNATLKISNMGRLGINLIGGVDVSTMTSLHLDIFSLNATKYNLILFNYSAGNPQTLFPLTTTLNGWNSFEIPMTGLTKVDQILLVASPDTINTIASTTTTGVAYVDNIYFWNNIVTKLSTCGITAPYLDYDVKAFPVSGATQYEFAVTNTSTNVTTNGVFSRSYFNLLTELPGGVQQGRTYSIKVRYNNGTWQPYGDDCTITTAPAVTSTQVRPFQCGATLSSINTSIEASPVYLATQYEFEVTYGPTTVVVPSNQYHFKLSSLPPGGATYNTAYSVRVRAFVGSWLNWGATCVVSTPGPILRKGGNSLENVFEAKAFPNPFATNFRLNIESSSDDVIEMKVYDMIGRQLEAKNATVSELSDIEIGNNYPSGIYNVILKQGDNVRSIRMIKR